MRARYPLLRSPVFWVGLWLMGFLAWAWRDSWRWNPGVLCGSWACESEWGGVVVLRANGMLSPGVEFYRSPSMAPADAEVWQRPFFLKSEGVFTQVPVWTRRDELAGMRSFYELSRLELRHEPLGYYRVYVPYWLLMMVAEVLWVGVLVWRGRRWKRCQVISEQ